MPMQMRQTHKQSVFTAGHGRCKLHCTSGHDGGNRVFVNHLRHGVAQQHNVGIEGLDLALQLDAVAQINGHGHVLLAKQVEVWILQHLGFVIAHDMYPCSENE